MREQKEVLQETLLDCAKKTVLFFYSNLNDDGSYMIDSKDLSCYYKSPMMFFLANNIEASNKSLDYIRNHFLTNDGDFKTTADIKSAKQEYSEYWSYVNGWIIRAANKLSRNDVIEPANSFFCRFYNEEKMAFLTHSLSDIDAVSDVLTVANHGLVNLELGKTDPAIIAGNSLCEAFDRQPEISEAFFLRICTSSKDPIVVFDESYSPFYVVKKDCINQLYFMLGYPCAYLALLYKETNNEHYLIYAKKYMDFLLGCNGVLNSNFSHKLAWASSIMYTITNEQKYIEVISSISSHFIETQDRNGMWYMSSDINSSFDQSAEIACWFMDISYQLGSLKNSNVDLCSSHEVNSPSFEF